MSRKQRVWDGPIGTVYSFGAAAITYFSIFVWGSVTLGRVMLPVSLKSESWYLSSWMRFLLRTFRMKVEVRGARKLYRRGPVLIVSNHQSLFDIPAAFMIRDVQHLRMLAKKELFQIPIFGWVLSRAHFIPVDRKSRSSGMAASADMKKNLAKGICVWVAPEGTRSEDGALNTFRKGSFAVAISAGITVQPVVVWNSYLVCPKGSLLPRPGSKIVLEVLDPIEPAHPAFADRARLSDEARSRMQKALATARRENPSYFVS